MLDIKDFSLDQLKKAEACSTSEELMALAKSEGIELSDEDLDMVSGGSSWDSNETVEPKEDPGQKCPYCGSTSVIEHRYYYECDRCYKEWQ